MNAERLHAVARAIHEDLSKTEIVEKLEELKVALDNQVSQPSNADFQTAVVALRAEIRHRLSAAPSTEFSPAWTELVKELGVAHLLGPSLLSSIDSIFSENEITPAAAATSIEEVRGRVDELNDTLVNLVDAMASLSVGAEELAPGAFEVGVLIPRDEVDSELAPLGREFIEIERLLLPFVELSTGSRPPIKVRTISSSDFGAFLEIAGPAAAAIAIGVERVIAAYKTLLEIRLLRSDLEERGVSRDRLEGVDEHADEVMTAAVEAAVEELLAGYDGTDGRKNELRVGLRGTLNAIANRIDRGYNIEVRAGALEDEPETEDSDDDALESDTERQELAKQVRAITERRQAMQFINLTGSPILSLNEGPTPEEQPDSAESAT